MKKHLAVLLFSLLAVCLNKAFSQPTLPSNNAVIPIYFHLSELKNNRQAHVDQVFDLVCSANNNFFRRNGVKLSFYVADIDSSACGGGTPGNGIHVYLGLCPCSGDGCTSGAVIQINTADQDVFTHELGHALSLGHPLNGPCPFFNFPNDPCYNSGGSGAGDPDCITDTPPGITGNWMNSGSPASTASTFTACQKHFLEACAYVKSGYPGYWKVYPSPDPLRSSANYAVPVPRLDFTYSTSQARVFFDFGNRQCNGVVDTPTTVTCILSTRCSPGTNEEKFTYTFNSLRTSYIVPKCYGITTIIFKYNFPSGVRADTLQVNYTSPIQYLCACTPANPAGRGISTTNNPKSAHSISLFVKDKINYTNEGFSKAEVYDLNGRLLFNEIISNGAGDIDISSLRSGMYIFKATARDGDIKVIKFMKP